MGEDDSTVTQPAEQSANHNRIRPDALGDAFRRSWTSAELGVEIDPAQRVDRDREPAVGAHSVTPCEAS